MSARAHYITCHCGRVLHAYRGIAHCTHESQVREGGKWQTTSQTIRYRVSITEELVESEDGPVETEAVEPTISEREGLR